MGLFKNIKAIKDAVSSGTLGQMTPEQREEWLATLTPEQRAQVEANEAQVAEGMAAAEQARAETDQLYQAQVDARPLHGPAGMFLYGADPRDLSNQLQQTLEQGGMMAYMKASWKATGSAGRAEEAKAAMPEPEPAFADRGQQIAHEWTAREQARAPYLAPARFPVLFTRIAARAGDAPETVRRHLAESGLAGRPELVFGVYPVPDLMGGGLTRAKKRYIEWDVVHAAPDALPPAPEPGSTYLDGAERFVARASGEPSLLDEDMAITLLTAAGVGPERCTGLARAYMTESGGGGEDSTSFVTAAVGGVHVFHPADGTVDAALAQLRAARPIVLPPGPPPGVHIEVLNWRAIASAVQQRSGIPFLVPSPFPYLPSTPQELIKAYIDIVGVNPFDSYAAHVGEDSARDIKDRGGKWISTERTTGDSQPCVDGKARSRLTGGSVVVIAYRDRREYAEGRGRWSAYETDVLQAKLANGTKARTPITAMEYGSLGSGTRRLVKAAEKVANVVDDIVGDGDSSDSPFDRLPPHRYCWPPTDIR